VTRCSRRSLLRGLGGLGLAIAGCTGLWPGPTPTPTPTPVRVQFLHLFGEDTPPGQTLRRLLRRFNERRTGVVVESLFVAAGSYGAEKARLLASGTPPDIIWDEPTARLMETPGLVAVEELFAGPDGFDAGRFPPLLLDFLRYKGRLWVMPFELSAISVGINRDLFARYGVAEPAFGWGWDEMVETARRLTHPDRQEWGWGNTRSAWQWFDAIRSAGGRLWRTETRPVRSALDEPEAILGVSRYADLWLKHQVTSLRAPVDEFNRTGRYALWPTCVAVPGYGPALPFRYSATSVPVIHQPASLWCWKVLALFRRHEERVRAAWLFVRWFYETENFLDWAIGAGYLPITRDGLEHPRWRALVAADPGWQAPLWEIEHGYLYRWPLVPDVAGWFRHFQAAVDAILTQRTAPAVALPAAARAINALIDQGHCLGCD